MENKIKLSYNSTYDKNIDKEAVPLCNALNSLPSIITTESCCGHEKSSFAIYFRVGDSKDGLFFLTRCIDKRYWKFGHLWRLELFVGDSFENDEFPIIYYLHSGDIKGDEAYNQSLSLIDNLNYHLNHDVFMKYYKLDIKKFKIIQNES